MKRKGGAPMQTSARWFLLFTVFCGIADSGCSRNDVSGDPLASWNDTPTKQAIIDFVSQVTTPGSQRFVPEPERIAVFDNDGTLWSEQPLYFQFTFALDRVRTMAPKHPEWQDEAPFKYVLQDSMQKVLSGGEHALLELIMATHAGMTTEEFAQTVREWLRSARHPRFDRPYTDIVYQPMLELLRFLRSNGFKTFVVSGGGIDFMRPWTEEVYGIPPEQVVGSSIKTVFEMRPEGPVLVRQPQVDFIDDKAGKPVGIHKFIGRRPLAACGNSDGDLQMLQWTTAGAGPRFALLLHHTDGEREWAYDRQSPVGRLDEALDEAETHGWTVVDMKRDWKIVYPFEMQTP